MSGLPDDDLQALGKLKGSAKKALDRNIIWAALVDAIGALNVELAELRETFPKHRNDFREIERLRKTLKHYKRVHLRVVREGNERGWGV